MGIWRDHGSLEDPGLGVPAHVGSFRVARNPPGAGRSARWRLLVRMALLTFRYRRVSPTNGLVLPPAPQSRSFESEAGQQKVAAGTTGHFSGACGDFYWRGPAFV